MTNPHLQPTLKTLCACDDWRGANLLEGKKLSAHDEYWNESEPTIRLIHILNYVQRESARGYFKEGIRKASKQFRYELN